MEEVSALTIIIPPVTCVALQITSTRRLHISCLSSSLVAL